MTVTLLLPAEVTVIQIQNPQQTKVRLSPIDGHYITIILLGGCMLADALEAATENQPSSFGLSGDLGDLLLPGML